ncbi:MAG TPA: undecaprenyldiphospho-muramoylpentapeptide beta-N-acetylglucosaminyltransferase [Polyangia bacterium]|nr:undecaprenyldiphospho-muramoylpentapeptide beta-N-acetylglucosaminyltransferase [Polyangia bacterium]
MNTAFHHNGPRHGGGRNQPRGADPMRVIIAGGGTGGHLYPGIAIAEEVSARPHGEVLFVGTARGLESKLVPAAGYPLELLEVSGLKRIGWRGLARGLLRLPRAFFASRAILRRFRPDLVFGVGGYASGPIVFAAALTGFPTAILEQNSRPGFTNRLLGRLVRRVFIAFEASRVFFTAGKTMLTGNPVRRQFFAGQGTEPAAVAAAAGTVLVVGGSQGARAVNELVAAMAPLLARRGALPRIVHQTGPTDFERTRASYAALGDAVAAAVDVRPYIDDMPAALAQASLVIGRAGALTLAELAIVGRPAILIPLPTAADDHQTENARELAQAGAALVLRQTDATPGALGDLVVALLSDQPRRAAMARAMAGLGRPGAARAIVDELEKLAPGAAARGGS